MVEEEKRKSKRIEYNVEVTMQSEDNFFTGFAQNISSGGLFIATHNILNLGDKFKITLRIPDYPEEIIVDCEVKWIRPYDDKTPDIIPGMGVKFLNLSQKAQETINKFIRQRRRTIIFYEDEGE